MPYHERRHRAPANPVSPVRAHPAVPLAIRPRDRCDAVAHGVHHGSNGRPWSRTRRSPTRRWPPCSIGSTAPARSRSAATYDVIPTTTGIAHHGGRRHSVTAGVASRIGDVRVLRRRHRVEHVPARTRRIASTFIDDARDQRPQHHEPILARRRRVAPPASTPAGRSVSPRAAPRRSPAARPHVSTFR